MRMHVAHKQFSGPILAVIIITVSFSPQGMIATWHHFPVLQIRKLDRSH